MGNVKWFLGIRVERVLASRQLYLVQDAFINKQSWQQSSRLASPLEAFENNTSQASQARGRVNDQSIQV
jgi:hypothetical protein